jgi:hypothetical protein
MEPNAMEAILDQLSALRTTINSVRSENAELKRDLARLSTVSPQQTEDTRPSDHSASERRPKIKASDLPKFYGKDHEDIDQWIEKVDAIHEYSGTSDIDLLRLLPMILQDKALSWFTQLGTEKRATLNFWKDWKEALRNAFYLPNHRSALRRQCLYRTLRLNESLSDYFQDKQKLQHYVYPVGTSEFDLIEDMLEGIPQTLKPIIKANIKPLTTLEEFRRILIDLEPGLRPGIQKTARTTSNYVAPQRVTYPPRLPQVNTSETKPPSPCPICKGNHWKRDCPQLVSRRPTNTNRTSSYPNNTYSDNRKWQTREANNVLKQVRFQLEDQELDEDHGFAEDFHPSESIPQKKPSPPGLHQLHESKTPTFADCAINKPEGPLHQVCIDTGASISLMDTAYVKAKFPNVKVNYGSAFQIKGLGESTALGYIQTDLHFKDTNGNFISLPIAFFLAPNMASKVIIGTDFLDHHGAIVNLEDNSLVLRGQTGKVPLRTSASPAKFAVLRAKEAYHILPGHQQAIILELDSPSQSGSNLCLDKSCHCQNCWEPFKQGLPNTSPKHWTTTHEYPCRISYWETHASQEGPKDQQPLPMSTM